MSKENKIIIWIVLLIGIGIIVNFLIQSFTDINFKRYMAKNYGFDYEIVSRMKISTGGPAYYTVQQKGGEETKFTIYPKGLTKKIYKENDTYNDVLELKNSAERFKQDNRDFLQENNIINVEFLFKDRYPYKYSIIVDANKKLEENDTELNNNVYNIVVKLIEDIDNIKLHKDREKKEYVDMKLRFTNTGYTYINNIRMNSHNKYLYFSDYEIENMRTYSDEKLMQLLVEYIQQES